jgi:hypothetical protein
VTLTGCEGGDVTAPLPSRDAALAIGVSDTGTGDPADGERKEQRYWLRAVDDELDVITPADTWHRDRTGSPWFVIDPSVDPLVEFFFSAGRE